MSTKSVVIKERDDNSRAERAVALRSLAASVRMNLPASTRAAVEKRAAKWRDK